MAKRIILYNLAEHVTDEQFKEYVTTDKGPLISSLPSVKKYELVKITGTTAEKIPYRYAGIVHVTSIEEFNEKAAKTKEYQAFLAKFGPMVKDMLMLSGEEIY
jgi:plasmid replication initiation protein